MKIAGLKVVDANKPFVIRISERDVKTGSTKNPATCAVARACKRRFHATQARVYLTRTYVKLNRRWIRFQTPGAIRSELIAFDRGGRFEPGGYDLMPVVRNRKLGTKRKSGPKLTAGKRRKAHHFAANVRTHANEDLRAL